jgi:folylpolyglutamate synthase
MINDDQVDPDMYASVRCEIERVDGELGTNLTSFELLTLTALQIFEHLRVDIAIVEVGMGGRLDATNIIPDEAILVSVITNVDLDHQTFLGNTISAIAKEKAGIIRSRRPLVLGPQKHPEVVNLVQTVLLERESDFVPLLAVRRLRDSETSAISFRRSSFKPPVVNYVSFFLPFFGEDIITEFPLHGEHQIENLTTAVTTLSVLLTSKTTFKPILCTRLSPSAVAKGINETQWHGRLSFHEIMVSRPIPVLVDGAHNPASAEALANYITEIISLSTDSTIDLTYIIALSHSPPKTPLETLSPLLPPRFPEKMCHRVKLHVALVNFSPPAGMPWVKPVPPSILAGVVESLVHGVNLWVADDEAGTALLRAIEWASEKTGEAGLVVIAGSLYLAADFYRTFKV